MAALRKINELPSIKSVFCGFRRYKGQAVVSQAVPLGWEAVIGLEIHAQINSESKLFSGSSHDYAQSVNNAVSHFDSAVPGTLPVLSGRCVKAGILTSLGLNCKVNLISKFDRKHYFYADLPAGYQITQQRLPLASKGYLDIYVYDKGNKDMETYKKRVHITQLQLEQDSGKTINDTLKERTLVNLNRAGIGLMEIITEPDMTNSLEAACFVMHLQNLLIALGTCDGQMDKGHLRVDANISVNKPGEPMGTRTEVKNLNSFKFVARAIDFEIYRQVKLLEQGENIVNETLGFDYKTGRTLQMRDKEERQDYRYMPEPNLPPLRLIDTATQTTTSSVDFVDVNHLRRSLPELPCQREKYLIEELSIPVYNALFILDSAELSRFFFECLPFVSKEMLPLFIQWFLFQLRWNLEKKKIALNVSNVDVQNFVELVQLLHDKRITPTAASLILDSVLSSEKKKISEVLDERNLWKLDNNDPAIKVACSEIIVENEKLFDQLKKGKKKALPKLVRAAQERVGHRVDNELLSNIIDTFAKS